MASHATRGGPPVLVRAPARLHLGVLDLHGGLGRDFGSIGLALESPYTEVRLQRSEQPECHGPESERVRRICRAAAEHLGIGSAAAVTTRAAIPAHAGLGSGTQLALAVGAGLARLAGQPFTRDAARALDRGNRSGVGIAAFFDGGLIVDGGRRSGHGLPPVVARLDFPAEWRVLLVLDPEMAGVHGEAERAAFARLPPFPEQDAGRICRTVLMQVLPALAEQDLPAFGDGIAEIQRRLGDHFAPAQGGRYTSPRVARAVAALETLGVTGTGQSSWGPTGFAFASSDAEAADTVRWLRRPGGPAEGLRVLAVRGRNGPAEIRLLTSGEGAAQSALLDA
ncbi:MAG: hypothetical protein JWQ36_279 [Enterovirga sp.]|nr:hypothetical protein [Enterovirga sp.]